MRKQSPCESNNVFLKYKAQGGGLTPTPPMRTPLPVDEASLTLSVLYHTQYC